MSKILIFAALFSLALTLTFSQDAHAFTIGPGDYSRTTASLDPSKVCGDRICEPGENSKWTHAMQASQREGHGKATGAMQGHVIMYQLFVNSLVKLGYSNYVMMPNYANGTK